MFLKKSLLFTTALALLMFAGQTSAQPTVSLTHVPGEGGTEGMAAGSGTAIVVKISQTGVNDIPGLAAASALDVYLAFDTSLISLGTPFGLLKADTESGATLTVPAPPGGSLSVPDAVNLTFTTVADVTDTEFSIGITGAQVVSLAGAVPVPLSQTLTFNESDDGNGDTGMPPDGDGTAVSLTSGGASIVRDVGAGAAVVVDVAIPGLTANVGGGKITFNVDPAVAAITDVMPGASVVKSESSGLNLVLAVPPYDVGWWRTGFCDVYDRC